LTEIGEKKEEERQVDRIETSERLEKVKQKSAKHMGVSKNSVLDFDVCNDGVTR
jgi:hypothetical protein